jgi:hypothetical protein
MWNDYDIDTALLRFDWRLTDCLGLCGMLVDLSVFLMLRNGVMSGRGAVICSQRRPRRYSS